MSVILTGIEMPKNCAECPISSYQKLHDCPILRIYCTNNTERRLDDCPLKSVDGLIEKIEGSIEELRKYNERLHHRSNFHGTPEIHSISGQIAGLLKTVEIIKTYCGMEEVK